MTAEQLDFRILGAVRVVGPGGDVALGGRNDRAVLAFLLQNVGKVVTTDAIAAAVWNDRPPASHRSAVQGSISRLRTAIGSTPATRITSFQDGRYLLEVPATQLDWSRFRKARAEGLQARAAARADLAASALRAAADEWAGPAMADLAGLFFADAFAVAAEQDRLGVLDARIEAELSLGMCRDLFGELTDLVASHPSHEGFWLHLMRALHLAGRPADAIEIYQRLWKIWPEVTGLEVSETAQRLADAVQNGDDLAVRGLREGATPPRRRTVADHRHPVPPASLRFPEGTRIPIPPSGLRLGRNPGSDQVFTDETVSWDHAAVTVGAEGYSVEDLHSTNHTWVDGVAIAAAVNLRPGMTIRVGTTVLVFDLDPVVNP